jgi:hypothetical protein
MSSIVISSAADGGAFHVAACDASILPSTASTLLDCDAPRGGCSRPADTQTDKALFTLSAQMHGLMRRPADTTYETHAKTTWMTMEWSSVCVADY